MADFILDFEKPIVELERKINDLKELNSGGDIDLDGEIERLEQKHAKLVKKTYTKLSRWQRVQLARHPKRPYSFDYIERITDSFLELHGDRHFADDKSVITGIGLLDGRQVVFVAQQKGKNTKDNLFRNFGMSRPEGYRKALRIMKMSAKFRRPIICFVDTPGAIRGWELKRGGRPRRLPGI